jgi:hypothetical protein
MPNIKKVAKRKNKVAKPKKKKVSVKISKKANFKTRIKNPVAYFGCMKACCSQGISPKKITEVAHECKTNALVARKKFSAQKVKDLKKLGASFNKFQKDLGEYIKKH